MKLLSGKSSERGRRRAKQSVVDLPAGDGRDVAQGRGRVNTRVLPSAYATAWARFHQEHSFGAPSRSRPSRQLRPFDLASFLSTLQRHRHRRRCKTRYELPGSGLARRDPPPLDDTPFPLRSANAVLAGGCVIVTVHRVGIQPRHRDRVVAPGTAIRCHRYGCPDCVDRAQGSLQTKHTSRRRLPGFDMLRGTS